MVKVVKRNGQKVDFDKEKIKIAIEKAMNSPNGVYIENQAEKIADEIEKRAENKREISIYQIEDQVYYKLIDKKNPATAKSYEAYRSVHAYKREANTTDDDIIGLLERTNIDVMDENSNKNPLIASTQRDLIAGEVSKDLAKRKLIDADLVEAHEDGAIHIHDLDYLIQPIFNCCLVNMKDMLDNGTVINGKTIETPKSFQVACNVMTQIIAQIASNQYGGQSINISCLSKYLEVSYNKNYKLAKEILSNEDEIKAMAKKLTQRDLESGIQTIQYQINTLMTSNGQAPFVTLFMHTDENDPYLDQTVRIIEEILKQRLQGIKNEAGVYVTPAFPKLIYVLDENNIKKESKYHYLTELSIKCTAKMPCIPLEKKHFLRNFLSFFWLKCNQDENGNYKFDGRFNIGVCTINLPQIGILAKNDEEKFFEILNKRMDLVKRVGILRYEHLKNVTSDSSPIHFQHGAIARLKPHQRIEPLLKNAYATVTIGYIGIYEACKLVKGVSHTSKEGKEFALKIMDLLNKKKKNG